MGGKGEGFTGTTIGTTIKDMDNNKGGGGNRGRSWEGLGW